MERPNSKLFEKGLECQIYYKVYENAILFLDHQAIKDACKPN